MAIAAEQALLDLGEPAGYGMLHSAAVPTWPAAPR
jgi:hypothetical protein